MRYNSVEEAQARWPQQAAQLRAAFDGDEAAAERMAAGRGRHPSHTPGVMNKTEQKMAWMLWDAQERGLVVRHTFEPFTLIYGLSYIDKRIRTTYTPDFSVILANGRQVVIEVKQYAWEDAIVKFRCASCMFPDVYVWAIFDEATGVWTFDEWRNGRHVARGCELDLVFIQAESIEV